MNAVWDRLAITLLQCRNADTRYGILLLLSGILMLSLLSSTMPHVTDSSSSRLIEQSRGEAGHDAVLVANCRDALSRYKPWLFPRSNRGKFSGVLLNIHFNSISVSKMESSRELVKIYSRLFATIVLTSTPTASLLLVEQYRIWPCPGGERGFMAYECLSIMMTKFPNHVGYLQIHFDVLINWPALDRLPLSSVWVMGNQYTSDWPPFCRHFSTIDLSLPPRALSNWYWHNATNALTGKNVGKAAIWNFLQQVSPHVKGNYIRKCSKDANCPLNSNSSSLVFPINQMADVLYIPTRFVPEFQLLSRAAWRANLFLEFAAPAILCGMQIVQNCDLIQLLGVPHNERPANWSTDYVYHQNDLRNDSGLQRVRSMVYDTFLSTSSRIPTDLYGLYRKIDLRRCQNV